MPERKVYKFRIDPTAEQEAALACDAGARRFVFNWALQRRKETSEQTGKSISWTVGHDPRLRQDFFDRARITFVHIDADCARRRAQTLRNRQQKLLDRLRLAIRQHAQ